MFYRPFDSQVLDRPIDSLINFTRRKMKLTSGTRNTHTLVPIMVPLSASIKKMYFVFLFRPSNSYASERPMKYLIKFIRIKGK